MNSDNLCVLESEDDADFEATDLDDIEEDEEEDDVDI